MTEHKQPPKEKAEDKEPYLRKSSEYRRFKALLRKVVKAPPMRKNIANLPKPQSQMTVCRFCKAHNKNNATYCKLCGRRLPSATTEAGRDTTPQPRQIQSGTQSGLTQSPQPSRQIGSALPFWKSIPAWVYALVVALSVVITLLEGYPWFSLQRDDSLSLTNPYKTIFSVGNEGYVPIVDLDAECYPLIIAEEVKVSGLLTSYQHFAQRLGHG